MRICMSLDVDHGANEYDTIVLLRDRNALSCLPLLLSRFRLAFRIKCHDTIKYELCMH